MLYMTAGPAAVVGHAIVKQNKANCAKALQGYGTVENDHANKVNF